LIINVAFLLTILAIIFAPLWITKEAYANVHGVGEFISVTIGVIIGWVLVFSLFSFVFTSIIG
tara:strand:- start:565 stop:753 length:189 start_codon:yes stop_codon:yes gene_type:complete